MQLITLIKFGKLEHLEELRTQGLIYMNTLPYFWNVENDPARNDPFDCVNSMHRGSKGFVVVNEGLDSENKIPISRWDYKEHPSNPECTNLFCMYGLFRDDVLVPIDSKNHDLGGSALVFHDAQKFIDRVRNFMKAEAIKGSFNLVKYVDNNYIGDVGPFRKREKYRYQSEWRIVWRDGPGSVRKPMIGSLEKISTIVPVADLGQEIRIES
ncbi:MAG: hypothetical protein L3J98_06085 [Gammaproteobacteria bacterium]|nr:hypothetical protein [Gammaproteobacteria bacterium]MCF6259715.1 hypothetical protein [Gammaproteobacteria bacterium]